MDTEMYKNWEKWSVIKYCYNQLQPYTVYSIVYNPAKGQALSVCRSITGIRSALHGVLLLIKWERKCQLSSLLTF